MVSSPFGYDPFVSLSKNNFSNEEFERCFRYFDSLKYVYLFDRRRDVCTECLFVCRQGAWTREDFHRFLNALFSNKQRPYCILSDLVEQYFRETDFNQDEKIDFDEFLQAWKKPVKCVNDVIPMFCLILYAVVSRLLNLSAH